MKRVLIAFVAVIFLASAHSAWANPVKEEFKRGMIAFHQKKFDDAITHFEKVIEMYPRLAQSYYYLGMSHQEKGTDPKDVAWILEKAVELDANFAPAQEDLGKIYYSLSEFEKAEKHAVKAVELRPKSLGANLTAAWIYLLGLSDPGEAIYYFEQVLKQQRNPYVYFGLGMSYAMDEQKFKVLEMITELRSLEEEKLAKELERIIRDPHALNLQARSPLFTPTRTESVLVTEYPEDNMKPHTDGRMKVRLSDRMPKISPKEPSSTLSAQNTNSGIDRIKALRQRGSQYQSKGSGY